MSTQKIDRNDIDAFFEEWNATVLNQSAVDGFVDWAYQGAEKTRRELVDQQDDGIVNEIVYSMDQVEHKVLKETDDRTVRVTRFKYRNAPEAQKREAAQQFLDDHRRELIDALEEVIE